MTATYSPTILAAKANAIVSAIDAGSGPGTMNFYTGSKPANGGAITSEVLLATCVLSKPCATYANGQLTFAAIAADNSADANGTLGFVRILTSAGVFCIDLECALDTNLTNGVPNAGVTADVFFNTLEVRAGGVLQALSMIINIG